MKRGHDIVVVGASSGGIEALTRMLARVPADLPASVLVVVHVSPVRESAVPKILAQAGPLPAESARDGEPLRRGHVYVAPPDRHLLVADHTMHLAMGPKENNFRPAVDPLFRSAALHHGAHVIGIVLSGALDCGTAGLMAIKRRGGVAVVQDPLDASVADMPAHALANVSVDHKLAADAIGEQLRAWVTRAPADGPTRSDPQLDTEVAEAQMAEGSELTPRLGPAAGLTCPNCNGPLFEVAGSPQLRYRCLVGHALSAEAMNVAQQAATEGAFWAALRALEEQAALSRRLATRARELNHDITAESFEERAHNAEHQARIVREQLLLAMAPRGDKPQG